MLKIKHALLTLLCLLALGGTCLAEEPRYDFDCQNTKLADTIYVIAQRAGRDVVINGNLEGVVLSSLRQKTVNEALDILAKTFNFNWMLTDTVILVSPADTMLQNKRFILNYADLKQVKAELAGMNIPESNISINTDYNAISVSGTPYMLEVAERRIRELDVPVAQCLIVAQMVAVTESNSRKLGLQFTMPSYTHEGSSSSSGSGSSGESGSSSGGSSSIPKELSWSITSAAEKYLENGLVLARPSVLTQNGSEANIVMGDQVPILSTSASTGATNFEITYKDVGNKLKVTPRISEGGMITLNVETEVSAISRYITQGYATAPQISSRQAKTVARIKSGETLVIGGLMTQSELENISGIPGLMNLPILGKLFQYKQKTKDNSEVFVLLTPYIVEDGMTAEQMQNMMRSRPTGNQIKKSMTAEPAPEANRSRPADSPIKERTSAEPMPETDRSQSADSPIKEGMTAEQVLEILRSRPAGSQQQQGG